MSNTTSTRPALILSAYWNAYGTADQAQCFRVGTELGALATTEEAAEYAALFPKVTGIRANTCWTTEGQVPTVGNSMTNLLPNGNHGAVNETGVKRYLSIKRAAAKAGIDLVIDTRASNAYPTIEAFEQAIGA